jgi:putative DNA primase/helicase
MRRREASVRVTLYIPCLNAAVDDLDKNPRLLNVENGAIDLKIGELLPRRKEDMITKLDKAQYDKDIDCPIWKQFSREIMDYKTDLADLLQIACGRVVSGDTNEQSMFILYGTGANGKSTFLNIIQNILGDYALSTWAETFIKQNSDILTNDIARLRGSRFVTTCTASISTSCRLSRFLFSNCRDQMRAASLQTTNRLSRGRTTGYGGGLSSSPSLRRSPRTSRNCSLKNPVS